MDRKEIKSKIDHYSYEEILNKQIPKLAEKDPITATRLLANKLDKAISFKIESRGYKKSGDDGSYGWRPAIEEHENNLEIHDIESMLVGSLRDTLETAGRQNIDTLKKALDIIKEKKYFVFRRLELHIYRLFAEHFTSEIEAAAVEYFGKYEFVHEYYLLLNKTFPSLTKPTQEKILSFIKDGPDPAKFRGESEEFEVYKKRWMVDKLEPIKDYLSKETQDTYNELVKEVGTSELSNFVVYRSVFQEIHPPTDLQDNMDPDEVISFIKSYKVEGGILLDDGTASKFKEFVEKSPLDYSKKALELTTLHPIFSYKLLWGLTEAAKKKEKIDWENVLLLCEHIIQNATNEEYQNTLESIIGSMSDLLETGMQFFENSISFDHRSRIWTILEKLANLAESDSSWEYDYPKRGFDAFGISINSALGRAMHAVMQYSVWYYHGLKKKGDTPTKLADEVKCLLNKRLDPAIDKTIATHAVFGFHFANLLLLDKEWTLSNLQNVFKKNEYAILGDAAWDAYTIQKIYSNVFAALKSEYEYRINDLKTKEPSEETRRDARKRLAEHIGLTYLLKIKGSDELFELFLKKAPPNLIGYCLEFIGRRLEDYKKEGKLPEQDIKTLWGRKEIQKYPESCWFFVHSPFDKKFNLDMLANTLDETKGKFDPLYFVPEKLEVYANDFPLETLQILEKMLVAYQKSWEIHQIQDHARNIIQIVKKGNNQKAIEKANEIINFLGGLGYERFRDLL